ncbi:MAG TPA: peroxiredoxin [Nevskiaceae bacterium]|nr:peroxiredoxin [Nevskiaceae bacterium]
MSLEPGAQAPDLALPATGGQTVNLATLKGRKRVVYFYPKDNTPGCTQEGQDFRDLHDAFSKAGATVFGVSKDSLKSHENFKAKYAFPFDLISDADGALCEAFGVMVEKSLYGKKYIGIDRSTWLFDDKGVLRQVWRGVKVKGHAAEVLAAVKAL